MSTEATNTATTALAIASSAENVGVIVRNTPENYNKNQLSCGRCRMAGERLLDEIKAKGMSDALDQTVAKYIEKTRRTVKEMNERRAPVTKLFDQVRKEFTALENDIDPTKARTVPYQLQQHRNQYAAKKREQEEARRRAEEAQRQAEATRAKYKTDCIDDYKAKFNELINARINELTELNSNVTLENIKAVFDTVSAFATELPADWSPLSSVRQPYNLTLEESRQIRGEVLKNLLSQFSEQFRTEVGDYRQDILDRLPSKKVELERAAKANAAEAARIKAELAQREAAEAARKEAERKAREQEEAKKAEAIKANSEAVNLFNFAKASTPAYRPKTKVTKKINVTGPSGYMQVLSMWWAKEGCNLGKEELDRIFKKMITFCEKLANKEGEEIIDPGIEYVEDVKAQ
ncbi:MAG: hypothetical protein K2K81_07240 [Muribaculaceae bacterium]|nr:hypothetical protein [Muribaculaceae bacterium]